MDNEGNKDSILALIKIIQDDEKHSFDLSSGVLNKVLSLGLADSSSIVVTYYDIKNSKFCENAVNKIKINKNMPVLGKYKY